MFSKFFKSVKKAVIFILILGAVFIIVLSVINIKNFFKKAEKISIIIDSGSGKSAGSIFAITRALLASELDVKALSSSQWNSSYSFENKIRLSQELNETLLKLTDRTGIPALRGNEKPFNPNEKDSQVLSPASKYYIQLAKDIKKGEKINVLFLGALSNMAYAISEDPSIASKYRIYSLSMKYDYRNNVWNKNEANVRHDLDAMDLLLNTADLEMYILPSDLTEEFNFPRKELSGLIAGKGRLWDFLSDKFLYSEKGKQELAMPEIALIEALINPKLVKTIEANSPPENTRRKIITYSYINKNMMKSAFLNAIKKESKK